MRVVHTKKGKEGWILKKWWQHKWEIWICAFKPLGPAQIPSLSGSRYFVTFINDFSKKTLAYHSRQKMHLKIKTWKTQMEFKSSKTMKYLRTNNGLEFCNEEFNKYYKDCGITRHRIVTYIPQQNGLAKRMN